MNTAKYLSRNTIRVYCKYLLQYECFRKIAEWIKKIPEKDRNQEYLVFESDQPAKLKCGLTIYNKPYSDKNRLEIYCSLSELAKIIDNNKNDKVVRDIFCPRIIHNFVYSVSRSDMTKFYISILCQYFSRKNK